MPDPLTDETCRLIKFILSSERMRQSDLAIALGVTPANVSQLLNKHSNLTLKTIERIADALGYEAEVVFKKVGEPRLTPEDPDPEVEE